MTLFASVLVSACAAEVGGSVDPERGEEVGVEDVARVTGVSEGRVVLGNDTWLDGREIARGGFALDAERYGIHAWLFDLSEVGWRLEVE